MTIGAPSSIIQTQTELLYGKDRVYTIKRNRYNDNTIKSNIIYKGGEKMGGEYMTGKAIVNLIRELRKKGMSDTDILNLIEYVETHDPKEVSET